MKPLPSSTAALLVLLAAIPVHATPFAPDEVPAKANWYAHADLDTLRETELGSQLMVKIDKEHGAQLKAVKRMFSLNPVADLQGITLWGTGEKDKGAVIIRGRFDPAHLTDLIAGSEDYKTWEHEGTAVHTWKDKEKDKMQFGSFPSGNLLVISDQKGLVLQTIDAIAGRAPALEASTEAHDSVFALGVARLEGIDVEGDESQMLRKARSLRMRLFEGEDHMHGELTVETYEKTDAARLKKVLEGIVALGELSNKDLSAMDLDMEVAVSDGTTVTATLSVPHGKMRKMLELDKIFE